MKKNIFLILCFVLVLSCNDEAYDNDSTGDSSPALGVSDYSPSGNNAYWIYDVAVSSAVVTEMNFAATDSVYVSSINQNSFLLEANDDGIANGSMNIVLTNGSLSKTSTTLVFDGGIDLPDNLSDLGFTQDLSIEGMTLLDLDASNNQELYNEERNFSENIDLDGLAVPINISSRISTTKINFHENKALNGTNYTNVFEGEFSLNIEILGTFSVAGISQTIPILDEQDVLKTSYYYVENIGLVRAETVQGISLSAQLTTLLSLSGVDLDIPTNVSIENIEELVDFALSD
jgi:hypothetical protein